MSKPEDRRVTLEFKTKALRDEWMKWYARDGTTFFWSSLLTYGPRWYKTKVGLYWRKIAEHRIKHWEEYTEKFV